MDALFNLFKIKFDKIEELLNQGNNITENSTIVIYFNLEPIWRLMINNNNENFLRTRNNTRIIETAANIINIASHYRLWCKKHKLNSKIVLFTPSFSKNKYKNTMFNHRFRSYSCYKYNDDSNYFICQETIREAVAMAKVILEYIDGVYLIESYELEPSIVPMICKDKFNGSDIINFIVSSDPYDFQYSNQGFYVFRPKKEESFIIKQGNLIETIKQIENIKNGVCIDDKMYSFIYAILGDKNRTIDKIKRLGLSTILTLVSKAIENNLISDDTESIEMLVKSLKEEHRNEVLNNFYCIDVDFQTSLLSSASRLKIEYQIKDRFDMDSLIKLNNLYFNDHPIQLLELSPDSNYKTNKKISK